MKPFSGRGPETVYTDRAEFIAVLEQHGWTEESNADPENGPHESDCYGPWMITNDEGHEIGMWYHEDVDDDGQPASNYAGVLFPDSEDPAIAFDDWSHSEDCEDFLAPEGP